ncbi:MAG: hypothetical protein PUA49_09405, partial [Butyrivibrio sp.]|nr:hypothetical protein [Butyrivibrio sp.]
MEKLKAYIEIGTVEECKNSVLDIPKAYNKAIDDFANLMKEAMEHDWSTTKICDQIIYNNLYDKCNEIAEQLKAG